MLHQGADENARAALTAMLSLAIDGTLEDAFWTVSSSLDDVLPPSVAPDEGKLLVESRCVNGLQICFAYDEQPLSVVVVVIEATHATYTPFHAEPVRISGAFWPASAAEFDLELRKEAHQPSAGGVRYVGVWRGRREASGLQCCVHWSDGGTSRGCDGSDITIGDRGGQVSGCVELPLTIPWPHDVRLERMVSWYRHNEPFWMIPRYHRTLQQCPEETQFCLMEFARNGKAGAAVGVVLPLVDPKDCHGLAANLFALDAVCFGVRIESGWRGGVPLRRLRNACMVYSRLGEDVHNTVRSTMWSISARLSTFSTLYSKMENARWSDLVESLAQPLATGLGFCSWDAMATTVDADKMISSVSYLKENSLPISYAVVDDGWQAGGGHWEDAGDPKKPALTSFGANEKFKGTLATVSRAIRAPVYAWVSIIGYWGGVSRSCSPDVRSEEVALTFGRGLSRNNEYNGMETWFKRTEPVIESREAVGAFIDAYYRAMHDDGGVCGLKVDSQGILEGVCAKSGVRRETDLTRVELAMAYRMAMRQVAASRFKKLILNCMSLTTDQILTSGSGLSEANVVWRSSDDHAYPNVEEDSSAVGWHIVRNPMNCIWLGEIFPICDADMFRATDWHAPMHATLRIVSGGPVYISDRVPFPDKSQRSAMGLLSRLATSTGSIVRCIYSARPIRQCVFRDPRDSENPCQYAVWNRGLVNGVLAVFNLDDHRVLAGSYAPSCIPDFDHASLRNSEYIVCSSIAHDSSFACARWLKSCQEAVSVELPPFSSCLLHVCPVLHLIDGVRIAAIGLPRLLNTGATVKAVSVSRASDRNVVVRIQLADTGLVRIWMCPSTRSRLLPPKSTATRQVLSGLSIDGVEFLDVSSTHDEVELLFSSNRN